MELCRAKSDIALSNAAEAEEVVAELKGIGGDGVAIQADVSSPADVERLFNETSPDHALRSKETCLSCCEAI